MDSSGIISNYDNDLDLENEIYEDELLSQNIIEEENCNSSLIDDDSIYNAESPPPPPPTHGGVGNAAASFQSQVDAFVNATAALRRQLSSSVAATANNSTTMGTGGVAGSTAASNLLDALRAVDTSTFNGTNSGNNCSEPKLSWRQIFLGESSGGTRLNEDPLKDVRSNSGARNYKKSLRVWDDDFVLRRQFAALIPAFDPRPGRTNVNQVIFRVFFSLLYKNF